jgi:spore coat protein U-like protein
VSVTVYGRIPPGQDISAGSYSDTVTVVVNF